MTADDPPSCGGRRRCATCPSVLGSRPLPSHGIRWAGPRPPSARSRRSRAPCWRTTTPTSRCTVTSRPSRATSMDQLTFWSEEPPARTSPSRDFVRELLASEEISRLSSYAWLLEWLPAGLSGRTSLASCRLTEDGHLEPSSEGWRSSGMGSPTGFLTLNISAWPRDGNVCSLSDILETGDVPQRFFLSAKACKGILRRAEKRGKQFPLSLQRALEHAALTTTKPRQDT